MSRVIELEKALTTLFRKGTEVGYTETEIDEFLENIDYHALLQAVWNKAETVYAYRADGKNALSLDYRSSELFKQRATLLYEDVGDSYIGAVFAARSMELWLLEDISSIELDHIAAVGAIARVDEDHVWHTLPNAPGQEPVSIDRNSFERYLDTRYFEVSEPEPKRVIAAQHTEQPTPETPQALQTLMGQRVEIDGKLYNVDSADETVAHLSVVSSSSESNHEPEHRTEPVSAVLTRIADQGRELAPNISAYQALRAEHPEKLIGVRVGERLLFYGADAKRAASALNRRLLQRDIPGMGETAVTGYDSGQWASAAKRLLEHGHSFVFAQPNETDGYDVINEADAKEYIPIGMELEIDGRKFVIDSVNFGTDEVSLRDVTFQNRQGFPIFRAEHIAFIRSFVEEQEREQPQPVTKPVAFYPAEKTHLPYDIEIQTLHIPEPEHDPPSAEPAEPEPPAMSDEERLILEQEGRAALSEMGEFVPDFDDAISQAEIDEPPAHRPAVSIPVDGEWQGFPSVAAAEQAAYADFKAASHRDAQNFHITDDALGVGGAKAKFRANMAAIQLLQELEFEGLQASPEQQEILSRYVGWGGLADAFDENKPNWSDEFAELYSKKFLAEHESEITIHKAAKNYFDGLGFKKLPTIKALNTEYAELLAEKKAAYADYRKAREEMKELLTAKANIDRILELDKEQEEANERREKEAEQR